MTMTAALSSVLDFFLDRQHKHVVIRGNGVFGTTASHIISTQNAKDAVKQAKALKAHSAKNT